MTRAVVPIGNMDRRMVEHGRIRTGEKKGRAMVALKTFRFTSSDHEAVEQIAALYGGTPKPFADGRVKGQLDVTTDAHEIRVVLPPDPLQGTPIYELWSAGGCQRRCNGETCEIPQSGPEGVEYRSTDCICTKTSKLECKPITRLNVVLPEIRFGGSWRLESKGWNSAKELPGMVDMIQRLQSSGMVIARLALVERVTTLAGKTRKFIVPVLRVDESVEAIASGDARLRGALVREEVKELGAGSDLDNGSDSVPAGGQPVGNSDVEWEDRRDSQSGATDGQPAVVLLERAGGSPGEGPDMDQQGGEDDDIVDAEIVEEDDGPVALSVDPVAVGDSPPDTRGTTGPGGDPAAEEEDRRAGVPGADTEAPPLPLVIDEKKPKQLQQIAIRCKELGWDDDKRHALALSVSHGRTNSTRDLEEEERLKLIAILKDCKKGVWEWAGVEEETGRALLRHPS